MSNNPLEGIAKIYKEFVDKADSQGLAEVYKEATKLVFKEIKKELNKGGITAKITDVEYLDGYFIFGTGTNSVVHFHIDSTPGWKYGIWWSPTPDKSKSTEDSTVYKSDMISCQIFTQYEDEIDKFKPTASTFHEEFDISLDSKYIGWGFNEFCDDIEFIHKEPYLAFYREMTYTNFNKEHITRAKAKSYFERHLKQKKLEEEIKTLNDKELLSTIYTILKEDFDEGNCFIQDRGDHWHPRYEIVAKNMSDIEDGCFGIAELLYSDDVQKTFDTKVKECEKRAS